MHLFDRLHLVPPGLWLVDTDFTLIKRDVLENYLMWAGRSEVLG
jgi:hypothetical protein